MATSLLPNHASNDVEMEDEDEEMKIDEADMTERCLKQIQKWPQIMELFCNDDTTTKQLQVSFETLTEILQHVPESLPEHNPTVLDIIQKVLHVHLSQVYRALNGSNTVGVIMSALNLLVAMVTHSRPAAREVIATFNVQHSFLNTLVNRTNQKEEEDVRGGCIRFAMAFFVSADNKIIKQMLTNKDFLKSFFRKLEHDRASNIKLLLVTLSQYLVCNPTVNKTEKIHILNDYTLLQIAALYRWKGVAGTKLDNEDESAEDLQYVEIRQLCHQFLLKVTCDLKHGINFFDSSLGLSGKNCNTVLLKFVLSFHRATEDDLIQDLVVNILRTCPDLLNRYLTTCKYSFQPMPLPSWISNINLLEKILSGQPVITTALQQAKKSSPSYTVLLAMVNTIPTVLTPILLSQAVKHSSPIVSHRILQIIRLILKRSQGVIQWLQESRRGVDMKEHYRTVIFQYRQAVIKALPDVDIYISLLHKTLDRPLDADKACRQEKKEDSGEPLPEQETKQAVPVKELAFPKREEVLTILFDVLCAYQQIVPSSFAQTTYDFSRLPHMLQHASLVLQAGDVEEKAVTLLLGFPKGKLRGFKEVKGEGGSTVMLLLKQLMSAPASSNLYSLKIKLLNKFIKETGLFAQTEWEITLWLDHLTTHGQNEGSNIVAMFYKSLTQAIRNPHPFNDKVIEAMSSADVLAQKERQGAAEISAGPTQPNVLTQAMSYNFDKEWFMKDETAREDFLAAPLPCSALLPSSLEVFSQLEGQDQRLFGQYISPVILGIIDWQGTPVSVCQLLHQYTQSEGSDIKADVCWQGVMKYYFLWLPAQYKHSDLYTECFADEISMKNRNEWRSVLRATVVRGAELGPSDMKLLLQCGRRDLLPMTRQLLMYVNTLQGMQHKNASSILQSYIKLLEDVLNHAQIDTEDSRQDMQASEDTEMLTSDGIPTSSGSTQLSALCHGDAWWTDMASLVLQHAVFKASLGHIAGTQPTPVTVSSKVDQHTRTATLVSCFLTCLGLFKQQLPNDILKPILQPIIGASFKNFLDLIMVTKIKKNTQKKSLKESREERANTVELFKEICIYGEASLIEDVVGALIRTLKTQKVSTSTSDNQWQLCLINVLCQLLLIIEDRHQAKKRGHSAVQETPGVDEVTNTCDVSTLVQLALKFDSDQMTEVLLKMLELNSELTSAFPGAVLTAWLDGPSEVTSKVVTMILKHSKTHCQWFEDWCADCSQQLLDDNKHLLLSVVLSYCSLNPLDEGSPIVSILHTTYWGWLLEWMLMLNGQQEGTGDKSKMELFSHLLLHSGKDTVHKLLQSLANKRQEHHITYHRNQLSACQLAIERLACLKGSGVFDKRDEGRLREAMVACLQSLVGVIKTSHQDSSSLLHDHLLATTAIVKSIKMDLVSATPALTQVWKSFVRSGLKQHYQCVDMLQLMSSLVEVIYKPRKGKASTKETAKNLLPLSVLYQIVVSHSQFLPTLLADYTDEDVAAAKESLVLLMLTMVRLEPLCCHEAHYPVLIGAYNPTLSTTDAALLTLLRQYEINQAASNDYRPTAWGQVAISQHQAQKALGKSLWSQPTMKEILQQLEADILRDSALHFPLHRKLQNPYDSCVPHASSQRYDPCFLLPLFSHLLAPECLVDCSQFIESHALFLTLASLSSYDRDMRRAAYHVMALYLSHLEGARFRGRREVYYLMNCFKNTITDPNMRVPSVLCVFVARAATMMLNPEHFLYPTILQYLLIKPQLQMTAIPLFSRLIYSSSFKHEDECNWMVSLLTEGLHDSSDVSLYQRNSVFTTLTAFYQSKLATRQFKDGILGLLDRAYDIQETRHALTKLLLPCLQASVTSSRQEGHNIHPSLVSLMKKMMTSHHGEMAQESDSKISVPESSFHSLIEFSLGGAL